MNLKALRKFAAAGLLAVTGASWATIDLPEHTEPAWQDIASITWSTDGGSSWGNSTLLVGQSVEFKFTMHKTYDGRHYADFIKAWIDLDGNGEFADSETLLFGHNIVHSGPVANDGWGSVVNQSFDFISGPITLSSAMLGDHFLLARVTCSESLLTTAGITGDWSRQWLPAYVDDDNAWYNENFSPTAYYWQGQAQLVKLTVNNQVPEPGTLALFAAAMVGMSLGRKRALRV